MLNKRWLVCMLLCVVLGIAASFGQDPGRQQRQGGPPPPPREFPKPDSAQIQQMFDKMNRYSTLEAEQLFKREVVHGISYMFCSGLAMFMKSYFRKSGYKDEVLGFIFSVMDASGFFLRQAKLYLLNRQAGKI